MTRRSFPAMALPQARRTHGTPSPLRLVLPKNLCRLVRSASGLATRRSFPAIRRCRRLDVHTVRRRLCALSCRKISAAWCGARRDLRRGDLFRQYGVAAGSTYTRYAVALAPCLAEKSLSLGAERVGTCNAAIFSGNGAAAKNCSFVRRKRRLSPRPFRP